MKKLTILVLVLLLGGVAAFYIKNRQKVDRVVTDREFRLKDESNREHRLSDHTGKWVVVHFWASWCVPCLEEVPALIQFSELMKQKNLDVLAVTLDETWADARKIVKNTKLPDNLLILLDPEKKAAERFGTFQLPETYLLNPQGGVAFKWVGPQTWAAPEHLKIVESLMARGETPSVP